MSSKNKNSGLYIHIPFCISKCAYCDFVSYAGMQPHIDAYLDALSAEASKRPADHAITSVYIGGGTPTILSESQLQKLFNIINNFYDLEEDCEISIECNPATADASKLKALKHMGVNRLSIGAQSNCDAILKAIRRIHSYNDFLKTYGDARDVGFDNINIDIMYGLPMQSLADLSNFIEEIKLLKPEHISAYSLILEEGTPLYFSVLAGKERLPDEDTVADMMQYINSALSIMGYRRYEISNFSIPAKECRHNQLYWQRGNYIGLGCAAHSLYNGKRRENTSDLHKYISDQQFTETSPSTQDAAFERVMLALRTADGLRADDFRNEFNADLTDLYPEAIAKHKKLGNLTERCGRLMPTEKGMDILNSVLVDFL